MQYQRLQPTIVALSSLSLFACGDQITQPGPGGDRPATPALAVAHDTWVTRRGMPLPLARLVTAMVPNSVGQSIVYAIGGKKVNGSVSLRRVQAYNAATNTWSRRADLPTALRDQNGAGVIGGKIYVAGGITGTRMTTALLYMYDPVTDRWTRKRDMPAPGAEGASGVINGKLYVLTSGFFFRYNPATDRWIKLPAPKGRYLAGTVLYDKFYAVGDGSQGYRNLVMYDPTTNAWTTKAPPPPFGLEFGDAVSLWAKMYVIGFQKLNPEEPPWAEVRRVTWVYSPLSDTWSERTAPPEVVFVASKVLVNGRPRIEAVTLGFNLQYIP